MSMKAIYIIAKTLAGNVLLAIALLVVSRAAFAEADEMPIGLWQATSKIEMQATEAAAGVATRMEDKVFTICITAANRRKWSERMKNQGVLSTQHCERTDIKSDGNKVTWKMRCDNGASGEGTVTHNGRDAFTIVKNISSAKGNMKKTIEGKKIAETCER